MSGTPPRLLTIAGSDSGGGAGIQADLKTFAAFGVYGMSVVTAVTAQNTVGITQIYELPPDMVTAQMDAVFDDIGVDAVKIGMLASASVAHAVADRLGSGPPQPVVLDPVLVSHGGTDLVNEEAIDVLEQRLLPLATVITPNLPEAQRLTGLAVDTEDEKKEAARALGRHGGAVLLTGGHAPGSEIVDLLFDGQRFHRFLYRRIATASTHGTGCTLSAALAVGLGNMRPLREAVEQAGQYLHQAIITAYPLGKGSGPVNHLHRFRRRSVE